MPTRLIQLITPDHLVRHVGDVSPAWLQERGLRAVVADLDNTLVPWHGDTAEPAVSDWLLSLNAAGVSVCIASNTHRISRLAAIAERLGALHVPRNCGKPGVSGLRRALELLGSSPGETTMVGDQIFTDVVAGNRLGLTTVLVNPLSPREFIGTRLVSRTAERWLLRGPRARPN